MKIVRKQKQQGLNKKLIAEKKGVSVADQEEEHLLQVGAVFPAQVRVEENLQQVQDKHCFAALESGPDYY